MKRTNLFLHRICRPQPVSQLDVAIVFEIASLLCDFVDAQRGVDRGHGEDAAMRGADE
jgi:hypothetical protein